MNWKFMNCVRPSPPANSFAFVIVVVCGLAVGGYAWLQGREPAGNGITLVEVNRGEITEKAVAVGQIEPRQSFRIKSKISGIVKRCNVQVGDRVLPGDPLIEILPDPTPFELVESERKVESSASAFRPRLSSIFWLWSTPVTL